MVGTVHHDVLLLLRRDLDRRRGSIKAADLPEAVKKAIQAAYPKGKDSIGGKDYERVRHRV